MANWTLNYLKIMSHVSHASSHVQRHPSDPPAAFRWPLAMSSATVAPTAGEPESFLDGSDTPKRMGKLEKPAKKLENQWNNQWKTYG